MHRLLHITLVGLLLLAMQSPPAWAHRHESLSPQDLAVHLRQYHTGTSATQIPQGWHVHRSTVQLIDPALDRRVETDLPLEGRDLSDQLPTNRQNLSGVNAINYRALERRCLERLASTPLFRVYQSLLI